MIFNMCLHLVFFIFLLTTPFLISFLQDIHVWRDLLNLERYSLALNYAKSEQQRQIVAQKRAEAAFRVSYIKIFCFYFFFAFSFLCVHRFLYLHLFT